MRGLLLTLVVVGCGDDGHGGAVDAAAGDASIDSVTVDEGPNLLTNSDFEQLDNAGWAVDWQNLDLNPNGQIVVSDMAHSGTHALQWQMEAAGDGREYWVTQHGLTPQQIRAGHSYALVGWYHVDQPGEVALNYIVRGQPNDTPDLSTISDAPIFPTVVGQWAPFRFEMTIPADATPTMYEVSIHSIKFNTAATKLTVDNVRLFELPPG